MIAGTLAPNEDQNKKFKINKMKSYLCYTVVLLMVSVQLSCNDNDTGLIQGPEVEVGNVRVPAEWEPHAATWMQWANDYDLKVLKTFANMIQLIQQYEPVHLLVAENEKEYTMEYMSKQGVSSENISYHEMPLDYSWMRDNGPIYVTDGTKTWVQNWKFNGWNGGFGNYPSPNDNKVPAKVAGILNVEVEDHLDYVLEKGNVEVNGAGVLAINWDCQDHRNPGLTQLQHEAILKKYLGVHKIIWAYGHHDGDGTIGHIDGTGRFINENTIVINNYGTELENNFAQACKDAGFNVIIYSGDVNWLVGNGFVLIMGDGDNDEEEKAKVETFFPDRDVHVVNGNALMNQGGGFHCVTNDQPVF